MSAAREALRQQMLLRALWRDARPGVLAGWTRDGDRFTRALQAYQAHAGALAERALGAAYPVLRQLIGPESFAGLARALWQRVPPQQGDVAQWGDGLAAFLAAAQHAAGGPAGPASDEPYLPDVARLEWAVHRAETAADDGASPQGLERLARSDPAALWLRLRAGTALLVSPHPVAAIWLAHQPAQAGAPDRFHAVRQALAEGRGEAALVWRRGWGVQVAALPPGDAAFMAALLAGQSLGAALETAAPQADFDFERWLLAALHQGWLAEAGGALRGP